MESLREVCVTGSHAAPMKLVPAAILARRLLRLRGIVLRRWWHRAFQVPLADWTVLSTGFVSLPSTLKMPGQGEMGMCLHQAGNGRIELGVYNHLRSPWQATTAHVCTHTSKPSHGSGTGKARRLITHMAAIWKIGSFSVADGMGPEIASWPPLLARQVLCMLVPPGRHQPVYS